MKIKCHRDCDIERCPHRIEHERRDCSGLPRHCRTGTCSTGVKQVEMFQSSIPPARTLKSILEDELKRLGMPAGGVR